MLGQPHLVAVHADVAHVAEGDGCAARGVDLEHHDAALGMRDLVEAEVGARVRHLLEPHDQGLVAFALHLALERIEGGARDFVSPVGHAPDDPGAFTPLERRCVGQGGEVLSDLLGVIKMGLEFDRGLLAGEAKQLGQGGEQGGGVHQAAVTVWTVASAARACVACSAGANAAIKSAGAEALAHHDFSHPLEFRPTEERCSVRHGREARNHHATTLTHSVRAVSPRRSG